MKSETSPPAISKWIKSPIKESKVESIISNAYIEDDEVESFNNLERDHARVLQLLDDLGDNEHPSDEESMTVSKLLDATITDYVPETMPLSVIPQLLNSLDSSDVFSERLSKSELKNILNTTEMIDFDYAPRSNTCSSKEISGIPTSLFVMKSISGACLAQYKRRIREQSRSTTNSGLSY